MNLWYKRDLYLEKILKYLDNTSLIKVLIWQRRVWKSYIMKQIIDFLIKSKHINKKNIIYINFEVEFLKYQSISDLDNYIKAYVQTQKIDSRVYLFFDEIQELSWWEKLINSYRAQDNFDVDIFITGSNANLLSSDLSTYLAGRYVNFEIFPFSYSEYLWYFWLSSSKENFLNYAHNTGISEVYKLTDEESKLNFLKSLKDSIILKDIVKRHNIKDIDLLEKLFFYLAGNIGNLFSLNSLVRKLKGLNIESNTNTLWNYVHFLEKTYIFHSVSRYDLKWKKILEWEKKYYLNDLAFNNYFTSTYDIWWWKKLENIVYNHLKQNGYNIYVWNIWDLEIDFIAEKGNEKLYIQVAYLISDEKVFEREFWNLLQIKDNYPKYVLSLDEILVKNHHWIIHQNIIDFLSKN